MSLNVQLTPDTTHLINQTSLPRIKRSAYLVNTSRGPIVDESAAPQSTVMDETYKVAITRLGERIRVGGTAEVGDYHVKLRPDRRAPLDRSLGDLFPHGGDVSRARFWSGLRPMTPDGPPVIGPTQFDNLILNTGHGTLGWTMACGAGRVVADLIGGIKPEIPVDGLSLDRYAHS